MLETNRIDLSPNQQQHRLPPPPHQNSDVVNNGLTALQSFGSHPTATATKNAADDIVAATTSTTVATSITIVNDGNTGLTSPKRGDAPEELVPVTHGAFFFALGCGSALIVTLVAVMSALAYKRTNKSLLRSKSKESLQ